MQEGERAMVRSEVSLPIMESFADVGEGMKSFVASQWHGLRLQFRKDVISVRKIIENVIKSFTASQWQGVRFPFQTHAILA